ncbi:MAG: DUF1576 domain-containing protein [Clostridiaceae bacterium]|nr:DUF1576 domain-containing protein [Clostridiaceae bacterium]
MREYLAGQFIQMSDPIGKNKREKQDHLPRGVALLESDTRIVHLFFLVFSLFFLFASPFAGPLDQLIPGFVRILTSPQVLTTDACALGGLNGALLNAGLLGLLSWALMKFSGDTATGASFSAFFLTLGYAFFGMNCLNVLPLILGTWIFSKIKRRLFRNYVNLSLFACSLAPLVSEALFPRYYDYSLLIGIPLALLLGLLIGVIFPLFAAHTAGMHKGHSLFNAGLTAGLLGLALFALYKTLVLAPLGVVSDYQLNSILSTGYPLFFPLALAALFTATLLAGILLNGRSFKGYGNLLRQSGYKCDFLAQEGAARVFINFGFLGLMALLYMVLVKAPFTGPTVTSILCLACLSATGSHLLNVLPIMAGYGLVSIFAMWTLGTQAIVVGVCFATCLSPISGRGGWLWGLAAGALHAGLVSYMPVLHGGFNLYNGGFTAGLAAIILVPLLEYYKKTPVPE